MTVPPRNTQRLPVAEVNQPTDLDLQRVIEDIAARVRLTALFVLAIGLMLFSVFFVLIALHGPGDLGELTSRLCGVLFTLGGALFLGILAKDFRARKWWTFDIVEYLTWNLWLYPKRLRVAMRDERMLAAFGFDEYSVPAESGSVTEEIKRGGDHNP